MSPGLGRFVSLFRGSQAGMQGFSCTSEIYSEGASLRFQTCDSVREPRRSGNNWLSFDPVWGCRRAWDTILFPPIASWANTCNIAFKV